MKKLLFILFIIISSFTAKAQLTYVPDDNFEQALIDLGYDSGALDDYVPTNNIQNIGLLDIWARGINDLTGIEDFTGLYYLDCSANNLIELDVRNSVGLQELYCNANQITSLNLSQNTILNKLSCSGNQLTVLNVKNTNNSNITNFSASSNPNLTCIEVDDATYSTANWTGIDAQTSFSVDCGLTFVPDNNFEQALIDLGYDSGALNDHIPTTNINSITSLNVSNKNIADLTGIEDFIGLQTLICNTNYLTNIDITQNTALDYFDCNFNQLTNLDLSQNTLLTVLACRANQITSLDVSNNSLLQYFSCRDNALVDLDVSNNPDLVRLWCFNNQLTSLNMKNSANTNIGNSDFNTTNNPDLACIQIDDLAWSISNWTNIDPQSFFSEDCDATYVPDDNFEQALIDLGYDSGALDNYVTTSNINSITFLNVSGKNIADLTGIEDFISLISLNCYDNLLTSLNVSSNTALNDLFCFNNQLTDLNLSNNVALDNLRCEDNLLTDLEVSNNVNLAYLVCKNNQITSLDLSLNTSLNRIWCQNNQLTSLDVKNGNNSTILSVDFKASANPNLYCINVDDLTYSTSNWSTTVNIDSQSYYSEDCNATYVPDDNFEQALIDLGYDSVLDNYVLTTNINTTTSLDVSFSSIADLTGIEGFVALTSLNCYSNSLTTLDISQNLNITELICSSNQLTNLDLSQNSALANLNCQSNDITNIDLSQNTTLTDLNIKNNQLSSLDISQNTALSVLDCRNNQITILDLPNNPSLTSVNCSSNQLVDLNISNNPSITFLNTANNSLESLNMANGSNTSITTFFATNNPNLTCINVDDVAWSTSNWANIDAQSYFSTDCNTTYVPDDNFEQALIDLGYDSGALDNHVPTANIESLASLDVSGKNIANLTGIEDFIALTFLNCKNNSLNNIDLSQNTLLTFLDCGINQLSNLTVSNNTNLEYLWCASNLLTTIDVSNNTLITDFRCNENLLITLNMSQNLALEKLNANNNQLSSINLGLNTTLSELWCENNQLTSLLLSDNTGLIKLYCKNNMLSNLNLTQNANLLVLSCDDNQLSNINIGNNTILTNFLAKNNQLINIDITQNTAISYFYVENNSLTGLNLRNGNNTNMDIRATGNPSLTCIEVDDVAWSTANWISGIDATSSFSENCNLSVTNFNMDKAISVYPNPTRGIVRIQNKGDFQIDHLIIYNSVGKVVYKTESTNDSLNLSDLSNGIYFIKIVSSKQMTIKKIIINK